MDKLRDSGIDAIGFVPWGSHYSQLYKIKDDLIDILVPYFKAGLLNNEACLCITTEYNDEKAITEAMVKVMPDLDKYINRGQMRFVCYEDICLDNNKAKIEMLLKECIDLHNKALADGYDGLRISGDEGWVEKNHWNDSISCETHLNYLIEKYNFLVLCTYNLDRCETSYLISIIQSHKAILIRKDSKCVLIESSKVNETNENLSNTRRLYSVLSKINDAIIRIKDSELLYREACKIVVEEGLFSVAWIGVVNKKTKEIENTIQWGFDKNELIDIEYNFRSSSIKNYKFLYEAIITGKYNINNYVYKDFKDYFGYDICIKHNIKSFAIFPLSINGEVFAVMNFYSTLYPFIKEEDVMLLKQLCEEISFAVDNIQKDTLRKQIEKELRQSEARYRMIFELSPEAIFVHSDFKIIYANSATATLLGAKNIDEVIGSSLLSFIHKDYYNMVFTRRERLKYKNGPLPFAELKLVRLDGTLIDVEASGDYFAEKAGQAIISVIRNITERKNFELIRKTSEENMKLLNEAREYDKLKTEFFANISHELRTPINVMFSAVQLLKLYMSKDKFENNQEKLTKYIYTMQKNCYRLLRLVSNIIDITKIDAGFFELQLGNHNIVNIIEDITMSVSDYMEHKGITLTFDTEIEELNMACDSDKMERIMLNLLSNSIKFTSEGGNIDVSIYYRQKNVVISVKDNGIGIPKEKLKLVFERFQQVDKSLRRSHEGSGIGLSIVKSLVELHGGTIRVESEYGHGTEFIVELPIKHVDASKQIYNAQIKGDNREKINIEFSDFYS